MSGGGGSGGQTVTQQSTAPPEVFQNALANTLGQAQSASQTPYENYPGQLQADFSPQQQQAFGLIGSTPGISAPYINAAAQHLDAATTPLWSGLPQYSQGAVDQYLNPYVNDVVHSTQAQFANTNAQAANQLQGNAASRGALGGDRAGVAQAVLRGQQELSQAPVIANLYNQGFQGAQQEFNQQQGAQLGADQANAWLNMQAGQGLSGLGNQALGSTLTSANALLGTGALQQQQAQQALNIPFSEWQAQRAYPYQNLSWLSGITQGLGATAGGTGTSTSTSPAPSAISQVAGLGTGIAGLAGAGNQLGWWGSGSGGGGGGGNVYDGGADVTLGARRGGAIHGFASGGDVPGLGEIDVPMGDTPDVGLSIFPAITSAGGGGAGGHGQTTSEGGGPSGAQQAQSAIGTIASLASIAAAIFAKRGGRVPHRAPGGHVPMMPDYAGDPAQPIWVNSAPSTQTGFQLPVMHANPSPTAGLGSGGLQSLADYLAGQKAGAWTPPMGPQGPAAVPAPAAPAMPATPLDGPLGEGLWASQTGNSNESGGGSTGGDPGGGPSGDASGGMEGGGGGGGGGGDARGGAIHRGFADGGDTGDDSLMGYSSLAGAAPEDPGPTLGGDAPEMPDIPDYKPPPAPAAAANTQAPPAQETVTPPTPTPTPTFATTAEPVTAGLGRYGLTDAEKAELKTERHDDRALNAWLALAEAGFGMAAGRSPHALENIGGGALLGVKSFASAEQAAKKLAESVESNRARLAESHDYHTGLAGSRTQADATKRYGIDARSAVAARAAELRAQGMDETAAHNRATEDLNAGRLGVMQQNADSRRMQIENTESYRKRVLELQQQGLDLKTANAKALQEHRQRAADMQLGKNTDTHNYRMARLDQIDTAAAARQSAFDETVKQHGIVNDRAAQAAVQRDLAKMTSDAIRIYTSSRDIMGKFLLTPAQAQDRADQLRAKAPAAPAQAAPTVPQVGEVRNGYRFTGGDPGQQSSWAAVQ